MSVFPRRFLFLIPATIAASFSVSAQVTCNANVSAPVLARIEGKTEQVADYTLTCTGGTPTLPNAPVPQVNFTLFLNTDLTSHVTQNTPTTSFTESVLLVDEPNTLVNPPQRPLLNCGNNGAPDNGLSNGPGVCSILSDGNPAHTYDGTQNTFGTATCDGVNPDPAPNTFGCGRPNAFQGRLNSGGNNEVVFLGVPFDPPGLLGTRTFRFTNIRGNAALLGPTAPVMIQMTLAVNGAIAITINPPVVQLGAIGNPGLVASIPTPNVVHIVEGFANSWKDRNVALSVANSTSGVYNGGLNNPSNDVQNVPGAIYNTEDIFQYSPLSTVPTPNPPTGFGLPVANLGNPFTSLAFGGVNTNIDQDGISSAGTRIALAFSHIPGHSTVTVPTTIFLHTTSSPAANSGVMLLTATDPDGAGPFTQIPGPTATIPDAGMAVYEVLYANPFAIEFADVPVTVNHPGKNTQVAVSFAPFYSTVSSGLPTPTAANPTPTAIPRFIPASGTLNLSK